MASNGFHSYTIKPSQLDYGYGKSYYTVHVYDFLPCIQIPPYTNFMVMSLSVFLSPTLLRVGKLICISN